jgi:hypothetical protein
LSRAAWCAIIRSLAVNEPPPRKKPVRKRRPRASAWGEHFVGPWIILLLALVIALAALSLYGLWTFWPSESATANGAVSPRKTVHFFGYHHLLSRESLFFVMVAFAGALGGMVHSLRSLAVYIGNRELRWSWVPFYVLKPVLGAVLATLLYFVLRAGLFSPSGSSQQASPYGFAAISALAGLFSDQAVEKLRKVAEEVFEKLPPGKDSVSALPLARTGSAQATSPTEASLAGTVNPRGLETSVQFQYGETQDYGKETPTTSAGAGQAERPFDAQLKDLSPTTTYHCRLAATSSAGTSYGEDLQFTTPATAPAPAGPTPAPAGEE